MTADAILAAADSPADVLAGYREAIAEVERLAEELDAAVEASQIALEASDRALQATQAAEGRVAIWRQAVDRLEAAVKFLTVLESN